MNNHHSRVAGARRGLSASASFAAAAVIMLLWSIPAAFGKFTTAITNSTNTMNTAGYFTCTSAALGDTTTNAYLAYPLNNTGPTTVTDVSGNSRPGKYSPTGITYGVAGPCPRDGAKAVTLNGTTGYITGAATPTNPQVLSLEIWFKTTVGGGDLISLGTSATGSSVQHDRHIFMSNSGTLTFGVYPNSTVQTIASSASYTDGKWHDVVATLAPSTDPDPGMRLYVDGALVASNSAVTGAEIDSGYWRIGYDNVATWGPNTPSNFFFSGSLAFASTYTYAMTPAQVNAHYRAGL